MVMTLNLAIDTGVKKVKAGGAVSLHSYSPVPCAGLPGENRNNRGTVLAATHSSAQVTSSVFNKL